MRRKSAYNYLPFDNNIPKIILVINGKSIKYIQNDPSYLTLHFLFLMHFSKYVVGYNLSPAQKAWLINEYKKKNADSKFLAITNDYVLSSISDLSIGMMNIYNAESGNA